MFVAAEGRLEGKIRGAPVLLEGYVADLIEDEQPDTLELG